MKSQRLISTPTYTINHTNNELFLGETARFEGGNHETLFWKNSGSCPRTRALAIRVLNEQPIYLAEHARKPKQKNKFLNLRVQHSPPTTAEVKNTCIYTSTPPHVLMAYCLNLVKHRDNWGYNFWRHDRNQQVMTTPNVHNWQGCGRTLS
jgi:hypothetical protein